WRFPVQSNEARVRDLGKVATIVLGKIELHSHNLRYCSGTSMNLGREACNSIQFND
ncbi:hypothetical protein MKW92_000192, partial [Papaver armeniacum]